MDNPPARVSEEQQNNSKGINITSGESSKFMVELAGCQASVLSKMLPKAYSLQIQREPKPKRNLSKKKNTYSRKSVSKSPIEIQEPSQRVKKTTSSCRQSQELMPLNNYSRASSQAYPEEVDDSMKPCLRILQAIKNNKTSWPFREPVDPIALNIPNYFEIIKQPMDLLTVQKNLRGKIYITPSQFHADVKKIIKNSYQFNKHNPEYYKVTSEFEQCYQKICSDQTNRNSNQNKYLGQNSDLKKKKSKVPMKGQFSHRQFNDHHAPTLAQKKSLANQIKKLSNQYLAEVAQIVYQGQAPTSQQVNIESLPTNTIRQLQRLVKQKMAYIEMNNNNERQEQHQANRVQSEQSSFESDSDT